MKRSSPLTVDRLEDRCVPSADPLVQTVAIPPLADGSTATAQVAAPSVSDGSSSFVIDVYLIDPQDPAYPPKPADTDPGPIPDGAWQGDQSVVPPINDPFWY